MTNKPEYPNESKSRFDIYAYGLLVAVSVLIRIPFLRAYDLVSYDGTYYVNQAKALLGNAEFANGFPIGYPLVAAAASLLIGDGVRAAQLVSFLAGIGSLLLFYVLAKHFVQRRHALIAALILAVTPLFVRLSLMTMSESLYIFWLVLGLLMFAQGKDVAFGLFMGMAAITRPEALGVMAVLLLLRIRNLKRFARIAVTFLLVYSVNVVVLSTMLDQLILLPKSSFFGSSATPWITREAWIDQSELDEADAEISQLEPETGIVEVYFKRLPKELYRLAHLLPVVFLFALYGIYRRRTFLLASFVPLLFLPLFSKRTEIRLLLPYVPVLILYALMAVDGMRSVRYRSFVYGLLALSTAVGLYTNKDHLAAPVSDGYRWAKRLGGEFNDKIGPGDEVGDRKPFFAFYAGGRYVEIPIGTYEEVLDYLFAEGVEYLVLHRETIHYMRPALKPLMYDRARINGDLRYDQIRYDPDNVLIYERSESADSLEFHMLDTPAGESAFAPSWSPDGKRIAFRSLSASGEARIRIVPISGGAEDASLVVAGTLDPLSWAPDSRRIAFANAVDENSEIFTWDFVSGETTRITFHRGADTSPSWSRDGTEIAFCSDRSGVQQIWVRNLTNGESMQATTGGQHTYPAFSHDGKLIACLHDGRVVEYNRETQWERGVSGPESPTFAPAWSPDDRFIAVTGEGWGGTDVYLTASDEGASLVLTEVGFGDGLPTWSPAGDKIAVTSNRGGATNLWILSGLGLYKKRLQNPRTIKVLEALP